MADLAQIESQLLFVQDETTKVVLRHLLTAGHITIDNLLNLKRTLVTAQQLRRPNPRLIAIFCLYLKDLSRAEIAEALACSEGLVRHSVSDIYQIFDLRLEEFQGTIARKRRLYAIAVAEDLLPRAARTSF